MRACHPVTALLLFFRGHNSSLCRVPFLQALVTYQKAQQINAESNLQAKIRSLQKLVQSRKAASARKA